MGIINAGFSRKREENDKLPPGQYAERGWPVLTYGPTPRIELDEWRLVIDGEVNKPVELDWKAFNDLPTTTLKTDIHCVTRWSKFDMEWQGVSIDELIKLAGGLKDTAKFCIAESYGGYTTNLPIDDMIGGKAMVATHADGAPLTPEHGGPARTFVPHLYLWKSAKFVNALHFVAQDEPGFWEVNGYHKRGDPWREQRYDGDD